MIAPVGRYYSIIWLNSPGYINLLTVITQMRFRFLYKDNTSILSDNSHHCSLTPLHMTLDSTVLMFQFSMMQGQLILILRTAVNINF